MSTFRNTQTGVVVTVSDDKDDRYAGGPWEKAEREPAPKSARTSETKGRK